jgi:ABC transporter substrate binding protein
MKAYAATKGIKVEEVTVSNVNDIQQAAQNLVSQHVDAVYVPTDNVVASAMSNLVAITDPAKIPVFGGEDNHVKGGALMSLSVDYYKLGYQTGLMAAKILTGEAKVEDMPIEMQKEFKLVVGKEKLEKLGITLPEDLMNKATMI